MEKLNISLGNMSERKKQAVNELLEDKDVQQLLKQRCLKENDVSNHFTAFSKWLEQYKFCKNCHGLYMCSHKDIVGYHYDLDENCDLIYSACDYKIQQDKLFAHKDNYLICDLSDNNLLNDLRDIDLSNESQKYKDAYSLCQKWLEKKGKVGFYFHGNLGVGKTYLLSCLTNAIAKQGYKVAFVNVPRLCSDIKNNITEKDYIEDKVEKMRRAYLLVLDDIGAENATAWIRDDILFPILDYRMENGRRTMFSSNCTLENLSSRFSDATFAGDDVKAARIIERIKVLSVQIPISGTTRRKLL